jgi:hypothetical protein
MLLHTLRRSHTLARLVLVWFVLAMGVAIAAPSVQSVDLGGICSAATAAGEGQPDAGAVDSHHGLQCVLCLNVGAPPVASLASVSAYGAPQALVPHVPPVVTLAARNSPLAARAPPAI